MWGASALGCEETHTFEWPTVPTHNLAPPSVKVHPKLLASVVQPQVGTRQLHSMAFCLNLKAEGQHQREQGGNQGI